MNYWTDQEGVLYTSDGNYSDQTLAVDMPQVQHSALSRKPPEPASYTSKAIGKGFNVLIP